jgi:hypothetical protein
MQLMGFTIVHAFNETNVAQLMLLRVNISIPGTV